MNREKPEPNELKSAQAKREASEWVVRKSYGLSPQEQDAFFDWLARDPRHGEEYQGRQKAWKQLDVLAQWRPEHSVKPNPDLLDTSVGVNRRYFWKRGSLSGIAALLTFVAVGIFYLYGGAGAVKLAKGPFALTHERHVLDDGTVIKLNKGAQAMVSFSKNSRRVDLVQGEAHFNIAKDAARPFIVSAKGVAVQAVGTMFNVVIESESVGVTVTEGRVLVGPQPKKNKVLKKEALGIAVKELSAGQRSVIDVRDREFVPAVESVSKDEINKQLTWLRLFDFTAAPLSEIVHEFNRHNDRQMVIEDPSIENLAVSASIQSDNIDVFISVLELTMDIEAERFDDLTILLRSKKVE